jgi:hypothetical protein
LQIFAQLAQNQPKNLAVQDELARAYETLADGLGRMANADAERLTTYKKSLTICEELLRQDNSNAKRQRAVALNLIKIGIASDPHQPDAILSIRKGCRPTFYDRGQHQGNPNAQGCVRHDLRRPDRIRRPSQLNCPRFRGSTLEQTHARPT